MSRIYDDSAASARAATRTTPVLFYLQAIMDYKKKEGGREEGAGRGRAITKSSVARQLLSAGMGGLCCCFNLFRYFGPHQLVLRRWQLVQFDASRWPIVRAFFPCRVRAHASAPC